MYRLPEKQTWSQMVLNCTGNCMQITYPFHQTEISWLFCNNLLHFLIILFLWKPSDSIMWIYAFERKKHNLPLTFTTTAIRVYFASLTLICKLPFIWEILLETKVFPSISRMFAFWAPYLFRLSRFFKLHFRLFISAF